MCKRERALIGRVCFSGGADGGSLSLDLATMGEKHGTPALAGEHGSSETDGAAKFYSTLPSRGSNLGKERTPTEAMEFKVGPSLHHPSSCSC